ncbi:MAG: DnaJ domain-containing protein [SAR324 cluster bacterium]|nr:DnaJ domain-containing protein [SAR324 cluster bacterium]
MSQTFFEQKQTIHYYQEPRVRTNDFGMKDIQPPLWFASIRIEETERFLFLGSSFRPVDDSEFLELEAPDRAHPSRENDEHTSFRKQNSASHSDEKQHENISSTETAEKTFYIPSEQEFYKDLNVFKRARAKEVKQHYRRLIKKYHPDQFGLEYQYMQEWMKLINLVHETHLKRRQRAFAH